jgi:sialic acid synthase SpsE
MKNWKIPLFKMYHDKDDVKSVTSIIKRGMFLGLSSETIDFEKMIAEKRKPVILSTGMSEIKHTVEIFKRKKLTY